MRPYSESFKYQNLPIVSLLVTPCSILAVVSAVPHVPSCRILVCWHGLWPIGVPRQRFFCFWFMFLKG